MTKRMKQHMKSRDQWPMGMPVSFPGKIILIGDSPGNSPSNEPIDIDYTPTESTPHPGFFYKDGKGFWDKIRDAVDVIARMVFEKKSNSEALSISGLLNCGVTQCGSGENSENDQEIIEWINDLIKHELDTRVIMLIGLNGKLKTDSSVSEHLLTIFNKKINWKAPEYSDSFEKYSINYWVRMIGERKIIICTSPNHPSRHPFSGAPGKQKWIEASKIAANRIIEILNE